MTKKSRFATNPRATSFQQLWKSKRITLSLGAYDQSRDFNSPYGFQPDPQWFGYLQTTGDRDGLLPTTLYVMPRAPIASDSVEDGCIGFGHLSEHDKGQLHYVACVFDPMHEISNLLQTTFLHAAVCGLRWVEIGLFKPIMTEDEWLRPWSEHSHSATHSIQSAYVNARAKLPAAPAEFFDWITTGDIPT